MPTSDETTPDDAGHVYSAALRSRIHERVSGFERRAQPLDGRRHAAVTLLLVEDDDDQACFVLTRRAPRLSAHAGQWALPGGRLDPGEDATDAALRECHEEVGADCDAACVLGVLDDYPTRSGYVITPVVVWAGPRSRLEANPAEVAEIHRVPVVELDAPEVPRIRSIPESDRPVISVSIVGTHVHAPTAAILYQFREVALRGEATRVDHFEQPVFAWK